MDLKNFLSSGYVFSNEENELESRYRVINILLLFLSIILFFIVTLYLIIDNSEGVIIYSSAFVLTIFSLFISRKVGKNNYHLFAYLISFGFYIVIIFGHLHEPNVHPFAAWAIIQIFISFLILDIQLSMIMSILYAIAIMGMGFYIFDNSIKYILLKLAPLIFATVMIRILDNKVFKSIKLLDTTNKNLEKIITERTNEIEKEKGRLYTQANYDLLTGLPNRNNFYTTINEWVSNDKDENLKFALFFIDIDRFKRVNDSFGHPVGDSVLQVVSMRLNSITNNHSFLYRISGDEFIMLLRYNKIEEIDLIKDNIVKIIAPAITLKDHTLYVSVSIGISLYPQHSLNADDLIRYADTSMFESKKEGMGICTHYSHEMTQKVQKNVHLETELHYALNNNEFEVFYQPQIDIRTNKVIGLEALVRWTNPELGTVSPGSFLPLAEVTGFIVFIDHYVLQEGMRQIVEWKKNNFDIPRISFNISSIHLRERAIIEKIKSLLVDTSCKAEWIELEITESHVMGDLDEAIKILIELRKLGITIAIDDFGTGYTSLAYLEKLPVDKLKIDRFFISNVDSHPINKTIVKSIIDIAKSIGLEIIAEGVERTQEREYLFSLGCYIIQGYLYYKPMPAKDIETELLILSSKNT